MIELLFGLELWATGTAAILLGFSGYLLGDLRGAHRRYAAEDLANEKLESLFVLSRPGKIAAKIHARPLSGDAEQPNQGPKGQQTPEYRKLRRHALSNMPPLEELRAEARQILATDNIWSELDAYSDLPGILCLTDDMSIGLVNRYRSSIEELRRANASQRSLFNSTGQGLELAADAALLGPAQDHLQVSFKKENEANTHDRGKATFGKSDVLRLD